MIVICRRPAGAFLAANLRARAAAGGCTSCSSNLLVLGKMLRLSHAATAHSAGRFPLPNHAGPVSCPATPAPEKQCGSRPKFLLPSSAPASGGFIAEPVGTRQCSPLRFDERAERTRGIDRARVWMDDTKVVAERCEANSKESLTSSSSQ